VPSQQRDHAALVPGERLDRIVGTVDDHREGQ
jgi:hypothetical protein